MSSDDLSPDLLVSATIRVAARANVPIVVRRRGHSASGTIALKINLLNGFSRVLSQARFGDELVWTCVSRVDPLPESDAEASLMRQGEIDPDSWLIEIEDKEGRSWFPGRIVGF